MSVHKRNGQHVVDTIWPDGQRTRWKAPDQATARRLDVKIRDARLDGTWRELRAQLGLDRTGNGLVLKMLVKRYMEEYSIVRNRRPDHKQRHFDAFLSWLGEGATADSLALDKLEAHTRELDEKGWKPISINKRCVAIHHMVRWAVRQRLLAMDPLAG